MSTIFTENMFLPISDVLLHQATQLSFTCSKPTIETGERGVKYVQS